MSFEVRIDVFEGPFDLLLQLIMKQEMDIHEVPVAQITAAFLEHIDADGPLDLETATEFILIAATLLLIKARSLIPTDEIDPEADAEARDAGVFLLERLLEYRQYANAAEWLADAYSVHGFYVPRTREIEEDYATLYPDPFEGAGPGDLARSLVDLLADRAAGAVDTSFIAPIRVSVSERMESIRERLARDEKSRFSDLASECASRMELIATFLAVLELFKRCEITLRQRKLFGEIEIQRREVRGNVA